MSECRHNNLLEASDVTFSYPGSAIPVFQPVSFTVGAGEYLRIDGRNGSGKTTMLKLLVGLLRPSSGKLVYAQGARVSLMNQDSGESLALDMTIGQHLKCFSTPEARSRESALADLRSFGLGLEGRQHEFIGHLSGGQRQIVALICALASQPRILCLDEFVSALDSQAAEVAEELIDNTAKRQKLGVVYVSHKGGPSDFQRGRHNTLTIFPHE